MTNSSDEKTTNLDEATAKFVALENFSRLESSLAKSDRTSAVILTFQDYRSNLLLHIKWHSRNLSAALYCGFYIKLLS